MNHKLVLFWFSFILEHPFEAAWSYCRANYQYLEAKDWNEFKLAFDAVLKMGED